MWKKLIALLLGRRPQGSTPGASAIGGSVSITLGTGYSTEDNVKPETIWNPSPNFAEDLDRKISIIVIHATATPGLKSPLAWLCDPASKASAHYLIDLDGTIYHLVLDEHVAWHAGVSKWKGREHTSLKTGNSTVNNCSIGIELVNANDGKQVYPKEQVFACAKLCKYLKDEFSVADCDIVGHLDVAPGRKNDPVGFDWEAFRQGMAGIS